MYRPTFPGETGRQSSRNFDLVTGDDLPWWILHTLCGSCRGLGVSEDLFPRDTSNASVVDDLVGFWSQRMKLSSNKESVF